MKSLVARASLAAGAVVLALAVCEAVLAARARASDARAALDPKPAYRFTVQTTDGRIVSKGSGPLRLVLDPLLSYRNAPNQRGPWFHTNARGYRGGELRPRVEGTVRVAVLGGSAAFGTGLRSDEETFAARLERALGRAEVVNAATVGHNSVQELAMLRTEILDLDPEWVVAFDGSNDFRLGRMRADGRVSSDGFAQIEDECWESVEAHRSVAFALRKVGSHLFRRSREWMRRRLAPLPDRYAAGRFTAEDARRRAAPYLENLLSMDAACRAKGSRLLVLLQPERTLETEYRAFLEIVTAGLRERGVEHVDGHALPDLRRPEHFLDDVHPSAEGHQALATAAAARLSRPR